MQRSRAIQVVSLLMLAVLCSGFTFLLTGSAADPEPKPVKKKDTSFGMAFIKPFITTGKKTDTIAYYSQIGSALGLPLIVPDGTGTPDLNPAFTMDQLNAFAGFSDGKGGGLLAADLDRLAGPILNDPAALARAVNNQAQFQAFFASSNLVVGELLAASFFAPKICNVGTINGSSAGTSEPDKYGWRKVVRLRPRPGSAAEAKKVTGVWLLFNYFVPKASVSGASLDLKGSVNTQAMLQFAAVQSTPSVTGGPASKDAAYWLDFVGANNVLSAALNASFDSGEGDLGAAGTQDYFVPTACAVCHGGSRAHASLNVMDTDHWYERVRKGSPAGTDFPTLSNNAKLSVLLDAGPIVTAPQFKTGFGVFRTLNSEVLAQNGVSGADIQQTSTKHWVDSHASSDLPLSLVERSLGTSPWTAADTNLLSYFDRYCYRCHNAIDYNIFDKDGVLFERKQMIDRLQLDWNDPSNWQIVMPQDRHLDPTITTPFISLLNAVH